MRRAPTHSTPNSPDIALTHDSENVSARVGVCRLCRAEGELCLTHVVPKFVFSWLRKSGSGRIRAGWSPNRRIQDGAKARILCSPCELLFSEWERKFAERVFGPVHAGEIGKRDIGYGPWALKFVVSVAWRVLTYHIEYGTLGDFPQPIRAARILNRWRQFLCGEAKSPGAQIHHLLPFDIAEGHSIPEISPFFNRYVVSTIDTDVIHSRKSAFVYSKLGQLLVFSAIEDGNADQWKHTQLSEATGIIRPEHYKMPLSIFQYLNDKANRAATIHARMSPGQRAKVHNAMMANADALMRTRAGEALAADVRFFGSDAFRIMDDVPGDK